MLKVIGNANRLAVVCHPMETEALVSALEFEFGIPQPTLSRQLGELRAGWIMSNGLKVAISPEGTLHRRPVCMMTVLWYVSRGMTKECRIDR